MQILYKVTFHSYRSHPMTLHDCLSLINVFMNGIVYWAKTCATVKQAMDAGYRIERAA